MRLFNIILILVFLVSCSSRPSKRILSSKDGEVPDEGVMGIIIPKFDKKNKNATYKLSFVHERVKIKNTLILLKYKISEDGKFKVNISLCELKKNKLTENFNELEEFNESEFCDGINSIGKNKNGYTLQQLTAYFSLKDIFIEKGKQVCLGVINKCQKISENFFKMYDKKVGIISSIAAIVHLVGFAGLEFTKRFFGISTGEDSILYDYYFNHLTKDPVLIVFILFTYGTVATLISDMALNKVFGKGYIEARVNNGIEYSEFIQKFKKENNVYVYDHLAKEDINLIKNLQRYEVRAGNYKRLLNSYRSHFETIDGARKRE